MEQTVSDVPDSTRPPAADVSRVNRVLAWVGIVAGVVFTVAVVFFSGFVLGRVSDGHDGWRGYHHSGGCPMMRDGGMMRPGGMMGPGDSGPPMTRPERPPQR